MKLLAIDGHSILYRAFYGVPLLSNRKGVYTNAIVGFLNILLKLQKEFTPDMTVLAFDVSAPTFRHRRYEAYKGTRKSMPQELVSQVEPLQQIIQALGYPMITQEGYEADDILGTLSKKCMDAGFACVIATGDRDALQLITPSVQVCLVKGKENILYDEQRFVQQYGIAPKQLVDVKALMGDASDNIPGLKGIGEKIALQLIQSHDDLDSIYQKLPDIQATPRIIGLLEQGKQMAYLSQELAAICVDVPIEPLDQLTPAAVNCELLFKQLVALEMFTFLEKLGLNGADGAPRQQTEVDKRTISIQYNPSEGVLQELLRQAVSMDFVLADQRLMLCVGDTVLVFDQQTDQILQAVLCDTSVPKRTCHVKDLFHRAQQMGAEIQGIIFDAALAAELLSSSVKEEPLSALTLRYLPDRPYELVYSGEHDAEVITMADFSGLCDSLEQHLVEQGMDRLYREIELPLCEVLADMEAAGFAIDIDALDCYGETLSAQLAQLREQLFVYAQQEFNPNSTKELGVILFEQLQLPVGKKTKTGYSTNAEVLEGLRGKHPIIETLLEYRKLQKLHSTYIVGLRKVTSADGRIHSTFHQAETRTGRISSINPNMQNIPVRTEEGSQLRRFFVAAAGYQLVDADYSQIELRILAHIAADQNMLEAFAQGDDIHQITASQVFGVPLEQVTPQMRGRAKAINFGIVYGIGAFSLAKDIHTTVAEAKAYMDAYLKTYAGVWKYMETVVEQARQNGYVTTLYGRRRDLPEIRSSNKIVQENAKRIALNTPIQGTAADIIKIAMIRVYQQLKQQKLDARIILQVHDELIIEAADQDAPVVADLLKREMEAAAQLHTALLVDVHTGRDWYTAKGMMG